ncbi:MAG: peptide-binding protein [Verrucomicrobiota bacterium]
MKPFAPTTLALASLLAVLSLLATGCGRVNESEAAANVRLDPEDLVPSVGGWLIRNLGAEPKTLNPYTSSDVYSSTINGQVYEGLLTRDMETLEIKGVLAESWEISEDGLTFTFKLREGVTFHDGHPLTIEDVKYSYDRIKDEKTLAPHRQAALIYFTGAEILDERTIQFTANEVYFQNLLAIGGIEIIPQHIWEENPNPSEEWDFNRHPAGRFPVGTGPYSFYTWATGKEIILQRYDEWNGLQRGEVSYPQRLIYRIVNEASVLLLLLKNGTIDMYDRIPPLQWERQLDKPQWDLRFNKFEYEFPGYSYLGFNLRKPPFNDPKVRQALAHLIDVDELIEKVMKGMAVRTSGILPPAAPGYDQEVAPVPYDPEKARQLLAEAGWKDTTGDGILDKDGQPFTFDLIIASASSTAPAASQYIKEDLLRAGINMEILKLDWQLMLARVLKHDFDAMMMGWALSLDSDPYGIWFSEEADKQDSHNAIGYRNERVDEILVTARKTLDDDQRNAMYRELHQIIASEFPVVFLWVEKRLMAVDKRWYNIHFYLPRPCYNTDEWFVPKPLRQH